jgi:tRNA pseudouridine55 synthase
MPTVNPTGFLNLNKPAGLTSHDGVSRVRRVFHTRKVGHGGTLDPAATGVLPIALGRATRFLSFLSGEKRYRATFRLGERSTTDDATGALIHRQVCADLTQEQVSAALATFVGTLDQVPPIYSAVRQQGKHLYELARAGATAADLQVAPRQVTIHSLQILDWRGGEFPEVEVEIACTAGTYIRSIGRDLGQALGCGGLMSRLIRLQSGPFRLETSISLEQLTTQADPISALQPIPTAFRDWPTLELPADQAIRWCCGQVIPCRAPDGEPERVQVIQQDPRVWLGLGEVASDQLKALRVLESRS